MTLRARLSAGARNLQTPHAGKKTP
jgi:hypothetical protein